MPIMRVNKTKNYTVMSNYHLRDKQLSLKAKGLLSVMLSLPDEWNYSIAGLCAISKESETSIKSTLNELKQFNYMVVTKKMPNETESGRIEYVYDIFEQPQKQEVQKQGVENLGVENLGVDFVGQLNTKELNTDEENTEILNTENNMYAFSKEKVCSNMYASFPEEKEVCASKPKKSRYIPDNYTQEQLREHIEPVIRKRISEGVPNIDVDRTTNSLLNIICEFYKEYYEHFGHRHRILSDKAYEKVADKFLSPPDLMDSYGTDVYYDLMERYFEVEYNKQGKYGGEIELSLSHFMSDEIRRNLFFQTCY